MDFTKLTEYLESLETTIGIPMVDCIVTKDDKVVYRYLGGKADRQKTRAPRNDDYYQLFSLSKVMIATAAMQLIEENKIHLYDPVYKYLPEFEYMTVYDQDHFNCGNHKSLDLSEDEPVHYAKNPIRIIDLLSMSGGLSYDENSKPLREMKKKTNYHGTTREMIRAIAESPLLYDPGTRWKYSLCLDVMAAVVEVVSGETYEEYLHHHIFDPLGAYHLTFHPTEEQIAHLAAVYGYDNGKFVLFDEIKGIPFIPGKIFVPNPETGIPEDKGYGFMDSDRYESAGAGLFGTMESYSKVMQALANGGLGANGTRILKPESVMMFTRSVTTGKLQEDFTRDANKGPYAYGLGVRVKNSTAEGRSPIGEFGWDGATGGLAMADPFNHISITYIHHVFWYRNCYRTIHPMVKDLVYEGLEK